jgi:hypothetical protein
VPKGGASEPALARQTISLSLPWASAMAAPVARGEGQRPLRGQLERDLAIEPVRLHFLFSFSLAGSLAGHGSERCTTPDITGNRRRSRFHFILRHTMRSQQVVGSIVPPIGRGRSCTGMIKSGQHVHKKPFIELVQGLSR